MSRTTTITFRDRGFWATSWAFAIWMAYLVGEIDRRDLHDGSGLATEADHWRVAAAITDFGADVPELDPTDLAQLCSAAEVAQARVRAAGVLSRDMLNSWVMVDDLVVNGGGFGIDLPVEPVLEVADGFRVLLTGELPADPDEGAWFLGTGEGFQVMPYRERPQPGAPRFSRRSSSD